MTNNTPAPADLVEAVAKAIRAEINRYWRDDTVEPDDRMLGQAALTAMRAYMASDGVTQMDRDAAIALTEICNPEEAEWLVPFYRKGGDSPLAEAFAAHRRAAAITPQPDLRDTEDTRLLNALRDECWDLRCFDVPTGGDDADVAWRVVGHWMAKPHERVIAEGFNHDPRVAIRAALAKSEGK